MKDADWVRMSSVPTGPSLRAEEQRMCYCTHSQAEHNGNGCSRCWWCISFGLAWVKVTA